MTRELEKGFKVLRKERMSCFASQGAVHYPRNKQVRRKSKDFGPLAVFDNHRNAVLFAEVNYIETLMVVQCLYEPSKQRRLWEMDYSINGIGRHFRKFLPPGTQLANMVQCLE